MRTKDYQLFDAHFHIIDPQYPLFANHGFLPDAFTCDDYVNRMSPYQLTGGAIVSGSFQAYDQTYLLAALNTLGEGFVGVTQIPANTSDEDIIRLHDAGVRAVRFNLYRGGSESLDNLLSLSQKVYDLVEWHVELYLDSNDLLELAGLLTQLPRYSIDHLGISQNGFPDLIRLVEKGAMVKATGFGRVNFDVTSALSEIYHANPDCLMFGTDLPSTRAEIPYQDTDFEKVLDALGEDAAKKVFCNNALAFYRVLDLP